MVANPPAAFENLKGSGKKMAAKTKEVVKYRKHQRQKAIFKKADADAMLASR